MPGFAFQLRVTDQRRWRLVRLLGPRLGLRLAFRLGFSLAFSFGFAFRLAFRIRPALAFAWRLGFAE